MSMVRVAEFPAATDLSPIRRPLDEHAIAYELVNEGAVTVLYVDQDAPMGEVVELLRESVQETVRRQTASSPGLAQQLRRTPVTLICLVLSILGALVPHWAFGLLHWLTFQDFVFIGEGRVLFSTFGDALEQGQFWRLLTPIFIHFNEFHIIFNGLWLWEFGRRIESLAGSLHFLMVVLVTGVISNAGQYLWSGPSLFGGMSGVIFGLLGYIWIRHTLAPHPALAVPKGIIVLMIGWLVVCMTGIIDLLLQGNIANAAHLVGLLVGMALGAVFGLMNRRAD